MAEKSAQRQASGALLMGSFNSSFPPCQPPTPPLRPIGVTPASGTINKRDKKRLALQERFHEISQSYTANRDQIYRERVRILQADINYINHVSVFDNVLLDDSVDGEGGSLSATASTAGSVQLPATVFNGSDTGETPPLGKHAALFVQRMNDTLEQKDASLVMLTRSYDFEIEQLHNDYVFAVSVAQRERERLLEACRQRLIANAEARRTALLRDKEKLDYADTNALLYHPTQFSSASTATPGGLLSNRKTRHTRHRLETDDVDGKKRRKTAVDDGGSPIREDIAAPTKVYDLPRPNDALDTVVLQADFGVEKLFSEKELNSHLQAAVLDVVDMMQKAPAEDEASSDEDDSADQLAPLSNPVESADAVAMERSGTNQSLYMTRSSRQPLVASTGGSRDSLGEMAGRERAADLLGTFRGDKRKDEEYNRAPPLSEQEVADDLDLIAQAIKGEDAIKHGQRASGTDRIDPRELLEDFAGLRDSWVQQPDFDREAFSLGQYT